MRALTDEELAALTRRLVGTTINYKELYEAAVRDAQEAEAYAAELEAKLVKAVGALEWFYKRQHTSGESPADCLQNGIYKAKRTLAELKGDQE